MAQRRYLESVSPYASRLFHQMAVPDVDRIDGLPLAVALQQQHGLPATRSSVGSVATLSNLLRMLYSRAGDYPLGQTILYADSFLPNTAEGACLKVMGLVVAVDAAWKFFADEPHVHRSLSVLREVGLGYIRLGQSATELSGGEGTANQTRD